jgi:HAMP domain-containing protein
MIKKRNQQLTSKGVERLLTQQTTVILNAVDERLGKMEIRINQKIDRLTTTLDKFLKRLTDIEDEFEIMKADINRMKKVIREKLGVELL